MHPEPKLRILLLVTNSFGAMNVIHSGLIKQISENYEVYVLSTLISTEKCAEINKYFGINLRKIDLAIPFERRRERIFRRIQKAIFFKHFELATQQIKDEASGSLRRRVVNQTISILKYLGATGPILKYLRKIIINQNTVSDDLDKLKSYQLAGVISTSPLDIRENKIVNFLRIPSLALVISWDNLTSKGVINTNYNYVLVWNHFMADEYHRFYAMFEIPAQKICIAGIPRFDIYFQDQPDRNSGLKFRRIFQIHANQKILLFATSASKHFPNQSTIVGDLNEFAKAHTNVVVIIKCHPGDDRCGYDAFLHEQNIRIWVPANTCSSTPTDFSEWFPEMNFLPTLSQMLKYCDVCINIASTMTLDALACNKPVISIAYDGKKPKHYSRSVSRLYDYSHQTPVENVKLDVKVRSREALFAELKRLLIKPPDQPGKVTPFIHHQSPKSVESTMFFIKEWLNC